MRPPDPRDPRPRRPNPVQPISQHRQQFSAGGFSSQPSPLAMGSPQPMMGQSPGNELQQQVQEMAMEIYARLATKHISDDHYTRPLSEEDLRQLAQHSQTAAKAFFESMGVKFDE